MPRVVISDTSPLRYLVLIGHAELLCALYAEVLIPEAVLNELSQPATPDAVRRWITHRPSWLEVVPLTASTALKSVSLADLDRGEHDSILLALELNADLVLMDDRGHLVFMDLSSGFPLLKVYSAADSKAAPFTNGAESRFSADGKWIAYVGIPGGAIFAQPFPGPGGRIKISGGAGSQPTWARDGKQVFYIAPDRKLMAVSFDAQHKTAGASRVLFQTRIVAPNFVGTQYDVAADGRFLINSVPSNYSSPLTLLTGWTAQLKR